MYPEGFHIEQINNEILNTKPKIQNTDVVMCPKKARAAAKRKAKKEAKEARRKDAIAINDQNSGESGGDLGGALLSPTPVVKAKVLLYTTMADEMTSQLLQRSQFVVGETLDLVSLIVKRPVKPECLQSITPAPSVSDPLRPVPSNSYSSASSGDILRALDPHPLDYNTHNGSIESIGSEESSTSEPSENATIDPKYKKNGLVFTLDDFSAIAALQNLFERYGRVSHMGVLDKSYSFFITKARDAAVYFKVLKKVAIVGGDPLCSPDQYQYVLDEFALYRKKFGWNIAFMGATDTFAKWAIQKKWVTMHFGEERVLNPLTNPVLQEQTGKRIVSQNKQLLDSKRGAISFGVYTPSQNRDPRLQSQLLAIYNDWRNFRNNSGTTQAFITVYDPFAIPELMIYIYTKDKNGTPNGFAALRKLGPNKGYHIDPCIAAPGAPRGISDLLIFIAMALLNRAGISYLSFGFEPLDQLGEINGMPKTFESISRKVYTSIFKKLPLSGKKSYHNKFSPDESQQCRLHLIFPTGVPGIRQATAMLRIANISLRQIFGVHIFSKKSYSNLKHTKHKETRTKEKSDFGEKTDNEDNYFTYH